MRRRSVRKLHAKQSNAKEPRSKNSDEDILKLVRSGVESFVLGHSTIQEFLRVLKEVTDRENAGCQPLTKATFSRIIREGIRKRNLRPKQ